MKGFEDTHEAFLDCLSMFKEKLQLEKNHVKEAKK
jgi:hypothetical protein